MHLLNWNLFKKKRSRKREAGKMAGTGKCLLIHKVLTCSGGQGNSIRIKRGKDKVVLAGRTPFGGEPNMTTHRKASELIMYI